MFSIFIKIFINIYIVLNFNTMFSRSDNKDSTTTSMESFEKLGAIKINETDHFVFFNLRNQTTQKDIFLSDDLEPYIDIYFQQITNDWYKNPGFAT